ncbi:response regulator transcription factor [Tsukamurella sp. 1534]|uniref:response regulator transcription factor n=1 Tax=Tsukamurella sp. 1534 TaxID=1151061 RepID=UPI0002E93E93|nr:response regulator transcription factor [Tsukamurella sp. 1534]
MQILYLHSAATPLSAPPLEARLEPLGHGVLMVPLVHAAPLYALTGVGAVLIETTNGDSFDACRDLRRISDVPIIMIGDHHDEVHAITALAVGADDYLVRPVSGREIDARLRAIGRRVRAENSCTLTCRTHGGADDTTVVIEQSGLTIDSVTRTVTRSGHPVPLTPTEIGLLIALASRRGVPQSRDTLLRQAWGHDYLGRSRIVDNAVQRLRTKIDTNDWRHIRSVRGFGYSLR